MNKILSTIIGFIFFGSIASAQLTEFSQGDILSAGAMNQNFNHLQNQFALNKTEVDCSSDNLTEKINQGYNHLSISGECSVDNIFAGIVDVSIFCGHSQSNNLVSRLKISGKTGKSSDKLTVSGSKECDGNLSALMDGTIELENLTIKAKYISAIRGANIFVKNSILEKSASEANATASNGGHIALNNVTSTQDFGVFIKTGGDLVLKDFSTNGQMSIDQNSSFDGDNVTVKVFSMDSSSGNVTNLNIDCSSDGPCLTLYKSSSLEMLGSTIVGPSNRHSIYLERSELEVKNSSITPARDDSGEVIRILNSYLKVDSGNTIPGKIGCHTNSYTMGTSSLTTSGCTNFD